MTTPIESAPADAHRPPHWKLPGTILWGIAIAFVFVLVQAVTVLVLGLRDEHDLTEQQLLDLLASAHQNGVLLSLATFSSTVICCALVAVVIKLKRGSDLGDYLALQPVSLKTVLKWLALMAVFIAVTDLASFMLGQPIVPDFMKAVYASAKPVWLLWVALVVAAPVFEETFFRGFVFKGFAASFMGPVGAIVATAGLWALIHTQYDLYGIGTIFCLGLLIGWARVRTGSLWVPLAMHAMTNFVSTVETALLR